MSESGNFGYDGLVDAVRDSLGVYRRVTPGVYVCECGHDKASHRPHGGRRVPRSGWVCRKRGCECLEYGAEGVTIRLSP